MFNMHKTLSEHVRHHAIGSNEPQVHGSVSDALSDEMIVYVYSA